MSADELDLGLPPAPPPEAPATPAVNGFCPVGCGETLALSLSGIIACTAEGCPRPLAVTEILGDAETGHVVQFLGAGFFTCKHPLRERLDDGLFACDLGDYLSSLGGDPVTRAGFYRATRNGDEWNFAWLDRSG